MENLKPIYFHMGCKRTLLSIGLIALIMATSLPCCCYASVTGGYMLVGTNFLEYIRITQTHDKLNGYVQSIKADLSKSEGFSVQKLHITGDISGSNFSLHGDKLDRITGGGIQECEGFLKGGKLHLHFPSSDGQTVAVIFTQAQSGTWNHMVIAFQQKQRAATYRRKWSNALYERLNTVIQGYQDAEQKYESVSNKLPSEQADLDRLREQERKASAETVKIQDVLNGVNDKLNTYITAVESSDMNSKSLETARKTIGEACASAVTSCDESASICDLSDVSGELLSAKGEFKNVEDELNKSDEELAEVQRDQKYAENHRQHALNNLRHAENSLRHVENSLRHTENDLNYVGNHIRAAEEEFENDKTDIEVQSKRMIEDSNEQRYLARKKILNFLHSLDNGDIVVGVAAPNAAVRFHPDEQAGIYWCDDKPRLIGILISDTDWYPVLLEDGTIGWIQAKSVKVITGNANTKNSPISKSTKYPVKKKRN